MVGLVFILWIFLVIDIDMVQDDCVVLLVGLFDDCVELCVIIMVVGNVGFEWQVQNVFMIFSIVGWFGEVLVYLGCWWFFMCEWVLVENVYGDGVGGFWMGMDGFVFFFQYGVDVFIELVVVEFGEFSIVCIGFLINIVMVVIKDFVFVGNVKVLYIMGGFNNV